MHFAFILLVQDVFDAPQGPDGFVWVVHSASVSAFCFNPLQLLACRATSRPPALRACFISTYVLNRPSFQTYSARRRSDDDV